MLWRCSPSAAAVAAAAAAAEYDVRLMWMHAIVVEMTVKMPAMSIAHCGQKFGHVALGWWRLGGQAMRAAKRCVT